MIAPYLGKDATVVVASKGIEELTLELLSTVLAEALPEPNRGRVVFLSGPSFAREVASGFPTDVVGRLVETWARLPPFRTRSMRRPSGSTPARPRRRADRRRGEERHRGGRGGVRRARRWAQRARGADDPGLAEMSRSGVALGADPLTFLGMAGVGDLFLTAPASCPATAPLGVTVAARGRSQVYVSRQVGGRGVLHREPRRRRWDGSAAWICPSPSRSTTCFIRAGPCWRR